MVTRGANNGTPVIESSAGNCSLPAPSSWQSVRVEQVVVENYRVKTFTLGSSYWGSFRPGQHVRLRLTAPDGYQAQRSYSIASAPETEGVFDLTVELVPGGEVSQYLHDTVVPGDELEVRGPIGGPFTWTKEVGGPLFLIGGGSGIVPLMSMLRHRLRSAADVAVALLYSSRSLEDIIYREELDRIADTSSGVNVIHTLTRSQPHSWTGKSRRIDQGMLEKTLGVLQDVPHAYVCGPTPLVESIADHLVTLGVPPERIRTERFGPSS